MLSFYAQTKHYLFGFSIWYITTHSKLIKKIASYLTLKLYAASYLYMECYRNGQNLLGINVCHLLQLFALKVVWSFFFYAYLYSNQTSNVTVFCKISVRKYILKNYHLQTLIEISVYFFCGCANHLHRYLPLHSLKQTNVILMVIFN